MKLLLSLLLIWLPIVTLAWLMEVSARAQTNRFSWWASPESNVVGYFIITGPRSQFYIRTNLVEGRLNTNETLTLPVGVTYTVVQAVTINGIAGNTNGISIYSNEVLTTNPPPAEVRPAAPLNLKATIQSSVTTNGPWSDLAWLKTSGPATNVYRAVLVTETER